MDYAFAGAILAIVLFLFGVICGVGLAKELAPTLVTKKDFVRAVLKVLLVGAIASAVVSFLNWTVLYGLVVGCMAGTLTALRIDFSEAVGPWKFTEQLFGKGKSHTKKKAK